MPFRLLMEEYSPLVIEKKINLELGFDCFALDHYGPKEYREAAEILADAGLRLTFHAPFYDLRPGALDGTIREASVHRLRQVFDLVFLFRPISLVCHTAFDRRYYARNEDLWLENSTLTWEPFLRDAEALGTMLLFENVYEDSPLELKRLLESLGNSDCLGICFDTGHWNAFASTPLPLWLECLGSYVAEIHLHDNHGDHDSHLPPGDGTFPFEDFFKGLKNHLTRDPVLTIEPHRVEDLETTLDRIVAMNIVKT